MAEPQKPTQLQSLTPQQWEQIESALFAGHKIQAVKLIRQFLGGDLTQAVQLTEQYEAELRQAFPQKFTASKSGCSTTAAAFFLIAFLFAASLKLLFFLH